MSAEGKIMKINLWFTTALDVPDNIYIINPSAASPHHGAPPICHVDDQKPGIHSTSSLWIHILNLVKNVCCSYMISNYAIKSYFAHATTAQLSWHVQNCDLIASLEWKLYQNEFSRDFSKELINHCEMCPWIIQLTPWMMAARLGLQMHCNNVQL